MRRLYILVIAVLSVYCLADAFARNGAGPTGRAGTPIFSADLINLSIIDRQEAIDHPITSDAQPESLVGTNALIASALPSLHPAAATAPPPPSITRIPSLALRVVGPHAPKAKTIARSSERFKPDFAALGWEPPQLATGALHSAAMGGCTSAKWSQPDAAGVPVLVCN